MTTFMPAIAARDARRARTARVFFSSAGFSAEDWSGA